MRDVFGGYCSCAIGGGAAPVSGPVMEAWVAGTNTILSIANGRARATRDGGNPRISRHITGLTPSAQYKIDTEHFVGTVGVSTFYRVSSDANLTAGDYAQVQRTTDGAVTLNFTAPAGGAVYFGIALASGNTFAETQENPVLTAL